MRTAAMNSISLRSVVICRFDACTAIHTTSPLIKKEISTMLGYMHYNRFGNDGFTDKHKARSTSSVQTCPVCLLKFDARGGTLPDGSVLEKAEWTAQVCTQIKD